MCSRQRIRATDARLKEAPRRSRAYSKTRTIERPGSTGVVVTPPSSVHRGPNVRRTCDRDSAEAEQSLVQQTGCEEQASSPAVDLDVMAVPFAAKVPCHTNSAVSSGEDVLIPHFRARRQRYFARVYNDTFRGAARLFGTLDETTGGAQCHFHVLVNATGTRATVEVRTCNFLRIV